MLRLTGGAWRGRRIRPAGHGVRPTPARVREALMHAWTHRGLLDAPFLDLFAGSGVMGLEALSRGAPGAVAVERQPERVRAMRALAAELALGERWEIQRAALPQGLARLTGRRFGVVFADPPYARRGMLAAIPAWLDAHEIACDELAVEQARGAPEAAPPAGWRVLEARRYGGTAVFRLARA